MFVKTFLVIQLCMLKKRYYLCLLSQCTIWGHFQMNEVRFFIVRTSYGIEKFKHIKTCYVLSDSEKFWKSGFRIFLLKKLAIRVGFQVLKNVQKWQLTLSNQLNFCLYFTCIWELVYGLNMANKGILHQTFETFWVFSQELKINIEIMIKY